MGGDRAPDEILKGCWEAVPLLGAEDAIYLVGDDTVIREGLAASGLTDEQKKRHFKTVATTQVIEMDESPVDAVRAKPKSSINVACDLVKKGEADVFVSAGTPARASPRRSSRCARCRA
jgi:glycerol-3-phosphate acyltransferase PlsX